jgi:hypothetical protein
MLTVFMQAMVINSIYNYAKKVHIERTLLVFEPGVSYIKGIVSAGKLEARLFSF